MNYIWTLLIAMLSLSPYSSKLCGTWAETEQYKDCPRTVLHFKGHNLRFENMFGESSSVKYKVIEKKKDGFVIGFEYTHNVTRPSGTVVERTESPELFYHVENGRPILSEMVFEHDGRGDIIMSEYLREQDFVDGFVSELKKKLNDRPIHGSR